MIQLNSPFKLTTHFNGWSRVLTVSLVLSTLYNFALMYSHYRLEQNLNTPRLIKQGSSGMMLPVQSAAFFWKPEVASDYIKLFLPVLYSFSPEGIPPRETWSPFINPQLLETAEKRFKLNQTLIESDGLHQTLGIKEIQYNPDDETAEVTGEIRIINRAGNLSLIPLKLTVKFMTTSDPLNPYGHTIYDAH